MSILQEQADVLNNLSVNENTFLSSHPNPSVTRKLLTNQKDSVIRAMNELNNTVQSAIASFTESGSNTSELVGDFINNPDMESKLNELGGTIIDGLNVVKNMISDIPSGADISSVIKPEVPRLTEIPLDYQAGEAFILKGAEPKFYCKGDESIGEPEWFIADMETVGEVINYAMTFTGASVNDIESTFSGYVPNVVDFTVNIDPEVQNPEFSVSIADENIISLHEIVGNVISIVFNQSGETTMVVTENVSGVSRDLQVTAYEPAVPL